MIEAIRAVLIRELEAFAREIELYPDDHSLWQTVPGVPNSGGNLGLHVAGNLLHFVGAVLGGTGYTRNRDLEFARRDGTRAEVVAELTQARDVVIAVLGRFPEETLNQAYPEAKANQRLSTGLMLQHLVTHLAFHLGQTGYLRRALTGDKTSSGALSSASLATLAGTVP
ncbi:MAG: DinB family protein [Gemmatimonadota bacterium]